MAKREGPQAVIYNMAEAQNIAAAKKDPGSVSDMVNPPEIVIVEAIKTDPEAVLAAFYKKGIVLPEKLQLMAVMRCGKTVRFIENPSENVQFTAVLNDPDAKECIKNICEKVVNYVYQNNRILFTDGSRIVQKVTFEDDLKETDKGWEPVEAGRTTTIIESVVDKETKEWRLVPVEPLIRTDNVIAFAGKNGFVDALSNDILISHFFDTNVVLIGDKGKIKTFIKDAAVDTYINETVLNDGTVQSIVDFVDMIMYVEKKLGLEDTPDRSAELVKIRKKLFENIKKSTDFPFLTMFSPVPVEC